MIIVLVSYLLLATQGLGNYFLGLVSLSAWKQVLVVFLLAYTLATSGRRQSKAFIASLIISLILIIDTVAAGRGVAPTIYNIFFYIGWVPFYVFGKKLNIESRYKLGVFLVLIILISGCGLAIQLTTGWLDFLKSQEEATIRDAAGEAQRFYLVYVTSTGVMPTLAAFFCLACMSRVGIGWQVLALLGLVVSALATASLAAFVMLSFCIIMSALSLNKFGRFGLIFLAICLLSATPWLDNQVVMRQIERVTNNNSESVSNSGRLELWGQATSLISNASPQQALLGRGIGSTNNNLSADFIYPHGESSYFQALIEGGILGLILRLMPFAIILMNVFGYGRKSVVISYAAGVAICCAVAPVFGIFGIQCGLGVIAGCVAGDRRRVRTD